MKLFEKINCADKAIEALRNVLSETEEADLFASHSTTAFSIRSAIRDLEDTRKQLLGVEFQNINPAAKAKAETLLTHIIDKRGGLICDKDLETIAGATGLDYHHVYAFCLQESIRSRMAAAKQNKMQQEEQPA